MKFSTNAFTVELRNEPNYRLGSSGNIRTYEHEHIAKDEEVLTNKHGIELTENSNSVIVLANGGGTGIHSGYALIDSTNLLVCCSDYVFQLNSS